MQDKTNDERLKILQERLAQLKQKKENPVPPLNPKIEEIKEDAFLGSVPIILLTAKSDEESKLIGTEIC